MQDQENTCPNSITPSSFKVPQQIQPSTNQDEEIDNAIAIPTRPPQIVIYYSQFRVFLISRTYSILVYLMKLIQLFSVKFKKTTGSYKDKIMTNIKSFIQTKMNIERQSDTSDLPMVAEFLREWSDVNGV